LAKLLDIKSSESVVIDALRKTLQSGNINFFIGSGCSYPSITVLGNIEDELQSLLEKNEMDAFYKKAAEFLMPIASFHTALYSNTFDSNTKSVLENYKAFIGGVFRIIEERKTSILPKRANIFSTNYDMFVELAFEIANFQCRLNDGFSRNPSLNNKYKFYPSQFSRSEYVTANLYEYKAEVSAINLVKVHGSMNWESNGENITHRSVDFSKDTAFDIDDSAACKKFVDKFALVLPRKAKFKDTLINHTYYDLLRLFANELDKTNSVLITDGFSFADEHILEIVKRALKNPTLKIISFCFNETDKESLENRFSSHSNVDVIYAKGEQYAFSQFAALINSLIPSDKV